MNIEEYYKILELRSNASQAEIKKAYRYLAKIWHPDRFYNDLKMKQQAEEKIKQINQAYQVLKSYSSNSAPTSSDGIKIEKTNLEYFYCQGVQNAERENYYEAIEDFSRAIRINPKFIKAYQYRGFIREKLDLKNSAKSDFQMVAKLKLAKNERVSSSSSPKTATYETSGRKSSSKAQSHSSSYSSLDNSPRFWKRKYTLKEHTDLVSSLVISPNNDLFVSGGYDNNIKLRLTNSGLNAFVFKGHKDRINCLDLSTNGKMLVSGSADKTIKLWDIEKQKSVRSFGDRFTKHLREVLSVAISPDGKSLISSGADKTVKFWDIVSGKELYTFTDYTAEILSVAINRNNNLFSTIAENNLRIRNISNGKIVASICLESKIWSQAFSQDGKIVATGGDDGVIRLWDVNKGKLTCSLTGHRDKISSVVFSADGKTLVSGSCDRTVKIWQLDPWKNIGTIQQLSEVLTVVISPDSKTIIVSNSDGTVEVWQRK